MVFESYAHSFPLQDYSELQMQYLNTFKIIIDEYFKHKPLFNKKDIKVYYFDEHIFDLNVTPNAPINIYVEINQPNNFKQNINSKPNKLVKPTHLSLKQIKNDLEQLFKSFFSSDNYVAQDKYAVVLLNNEVHSNNARVRTLFRIIPCFTYVNANGVKGVIYYSNNEKEIEVEYPKLSIKNINKKIKDTNENYSKYVLAFKNIFLSKKKHTAVPFEPFETILYSVPNEIMNEFTIDGAYKIINYLRNVKLSEMKSIDEQDNAFTSKLKSLSYLYAKSVIKTIEKSLKEIKYNTQ